MSPAELVAAHHRVAEIDKEIHRLQSERGQINASLRRVTTKAIEREQRERKKARTPNPPHFQERAERDQESA